MVVRSSFNVGSTRVKKRPGYSRDASRSMASVIENYRRFIAGLTEITPEVIINALEPTLDLAKYYTPEDTGELRRSAYLEETGTKEHPQVNMGFGKGGHPHYAAKVHENMEFRHKAPTQAKFLQRALEEDAGEIQQRIIQGLRGAF